MLFIAAALLAIAVAHDASKATAISSTNTAPIALNTTTSPVISNTSGERVIGNVSSHALGHLSSVGSVQIASGLSGATSTAPQTSKGVADFIMAGLRSGDVMNRSSSTGKIKSSRSTIQASISTVPSQQFSTAFQSSHSSTARLNESVSQGGHAFGDITYTGDCYEQWNQYYSLNDSVVSAVTTYYSSVESGFDTVYSTLTESVKTSVYTITSTEFAAQFPLTTVTSISHTTELMMWREIPVSQSAWNWTVISDKPMYPHPTITPPPCSIPSIVPQCQSSWDAWALNQIAHGPGNCTSGVANSYCSSVWDSLWLAGESGYSSKSPVCHAASVSGSICSSLVASSINMQMVEGFVISGLVLPIATTGTWTTAGRVTSGYKWDRSLSVAPGCTVGCQECRIDGRTVQLFYWPPATATNANISHPVTTVAFGTTLTSPTPYISYDLLFASDSCSGIGGTYRNKVLAVTDTARLSSLYGFQGFAAQFIASFNFTDLYHSPVPDSIYHSQRRCAISSLDQDPWRLHGLGILSSRNFTCARTRPYQPILSVPMEVRELDPAWASCLGGLGGVYDPPIALHPESSAAQVTLPSSVEPTTAPAPGSSASQVSVPATSPVTKSTDPLPSTDSNSRPSTAGIRPTSPQIQSQNSLSSTIDPPPAGSSAPAGVTPGSLTIVADPSSSGGIIVNGQTLGSALQATVDGSIVSNQGNGTLIIDESRTVQVPSTAQQTAQTGSAVSSSDVGSSPSLFITASRDPVDSNAVHLNGQTVTAGGNAATIGGEEVSVVAGESIIVGSLTAFVPSTGTVITQSSEIGTGKDGPLDSTIALMSGKVATLEAGSSPYTASALPSGGVAISNADGSVTVTDGGSAVTLDGVRFTADPDGISVGSGNFQSTVSLPSRVSPATTVATSSPVSGFQQDPAAMSIEIGSKSFTVEAGSNGAAVFGDRFRTFTVSPGSSAATIDGNLVSAGPSGELLVGSSTFDMQSAQGAGSDPSTILIGSETFTMLAGSSGNDVGENSHTTFTVSAGGPAVSVGSETLSEAQNGDIVDGTSVSSATHSLQTSASVVTTAASGSTGAAARKTPPIMYMGFWFVMAKLVDLFA